MRLLGMICMVLALAGAVTAHDLGARRPGKPHVVHARNVPDPGRQGGDTMDQAVAVGIPYSGTGTTVGFSDDYDEVCPYSGSTSPDVVYLIAPAADMLVDIDLLGSTYDTKLYVYDQNLVLLACNDDYYPDYVSRLDQLALVGGSHYFVIIDGYGGDAGDYVITITEFDPCVLVCPAGAQHEGEPPLEDGYVDTYNGGCNTPGADVFGVFTHGYFCGKSGWYLAADGSQYRDTDWFELTVPSSGYIEIIGDAERETHMFELAPQDCDNVAVVQSATMGPCSEAVLDIPGTAGETVWFWVGPTIYDGEGEYDYVLLWYVWSGLTEPHSWSEVKSLFD